jgi:cyclopropane fatty-acyl-phospholipid synthase-like methyltransferase
MKSIKTGNLLMRVSSKFKSYEYVDRSYDGKIVQIGMFEKITKRSNKISDRVYMSFVIRI